MDLSRHSHPRSRRASHLIAPDLHEPNPALIGLTRDDLGVHEAAPDSFRWSEHDIHMEHGEKM